MERNIYGKWNEIRFGTEHLCNMEWNKIWNRTLMEYRKERDLEWNMMWNGRFIDLEHFVGTNNNTKSNSFHLYILYIYFVQFGQTNSVDFDMSPLKLTHSGWNSFRHVSQYTYSV